PSRRARCSQLRGPPPRARKRGAPSRRSRTVSRACPRRILRGSSAARVGSVARASWLRRVTGGRCFRRALRRVRDRLLVEPYSELEGELRFETRERFAFLHLDEIGAHLLDRLLERLLSSRVPLLGAEDVPAIADLDRTVAERALLEREKMSGRLGAATDAGQGIAFARRSARRRELPDPVRDRLFRGGLVREGRVRELDLRLLDPAVGVRVVVVAIVDGRERLDRRLHAAREKPLGEETASEHLDRGACLRVGPEARLER